MPAILAEPLALLLPFHHAGNLQLYRRADDQAGRRVSSLV
jgi:hypothetical protein